MLALADAGTAEAADVLPAAITTDLAGGMAHGAVAPAVRMARCDVRAEDREDATFGGAAGRIRLWHDAENQEITISGVVTGLDASRTHGVAILEHEADVQAHWNPAGRRHGVPFANEWDDMHAGDLGNYNTDASGALDFAAIRLAGAQGLELKGGRARSAVGRVLVIYEDADGGSAQQPAGNAGAVVARCVLGVGERLKVRGGTSWLNEFTVPLLISAAAVLAMGMSATPPGPCLRCD